MRVPFAIHLVIRRTFYTTPKETAVQRKTSILPLCAKYEQSVPSRKKSCSLLTEYSNLQWLMDTTKPSDRLSHWQLRITAFECSIRLVSVIERALTNLVSRVLTSGDTAVERDLDVLCFFMEPEGLEDNPEYDELLALNIRGTDQRILAKATAGHQTIRDNA